MHTKYTHNGITWIDLEQPDKDEVVNLMDRYDIHPLVAEELLIPSIRPKVDLQKNCIYLILHFPVVNQHTGRVEPQEVDFIVGKDFLITAHYNSVDPLHTFSKMFEVNSILDKNQIGTHGGFVFFYMIRDLYRSLALELDNMEEDLQTIEQYIFDGEENKMVRAISETNRQLLDFRQAIRFHGNVLESFEEAGKAFFGKEFGYYLHAISSEYYKVYDILQGHKETLVDLRSTNDSLLTTKTNNIIKTLTIIAFTVTPINLATQILAMNTQVTFLQNVGNNAFFLILAFTGVTAVVMFWYFRRKRWF